MEKLAVWFADRFKPWFMTMSQYVGILFISFELASVLSSEYKIFRENNAYYIFVAVFMFWFMIDSWAKNTVFKKRINEIMDEYVNENEGLKKLAPVSAYIEHHLQKEGFCSESEIGEVRQKIDKILRQRL
jgi:nitrate/nitrite transporter NarK